METVDRDQQLRVKQAKLAEEDGRGRGRGRGKGKGRGRGKVQKKLEEEYGDWDVDAAWGNWYHSDWEWDYERGCWWWEVRKEPKGATKQKRKAKPGQETKVEVTGKKAKESGKETKADVTGKKAKEPGKEMKGEVTGKKARVEKEKDTKETDVQDASKTAANGKKRKGANQVEAEQEERKARRAREHTCAPTRSSKAGRQKKSKSQDKDTKTAPKLEPTPSDREGQILMLKTFALNNQHIKEDSLPARQELRDQMPPLQTCQMTIYWGEGRASCGLKHLKQGKNFGLYSFLNWDTSYINKMAAAIKAAHMLAACLNSKILYCQEVPCL